ncbi:MAG: c-type cytochrome [Betaproteobacteria bacterium]
MKVWIRDMTRWLGQGFLLVVLAFAAALAGPQAASADDSAGGAGDLAVPIGDEAAVALGKTRFGEKCGGFCHGSGGKGGRAPCLICGRFKRGGNNSDLYRNISEGVAGTAMGAFGAVLDRNDILAVIAYLRVEQKKKQEADGQ